jgi:hypothetical protein
MELRSVVDLEVKRIDVIDGGVMSLRTLIVMGSAAAAALNFFRSFLRVAPFRALAI